MRLPSGGRYSLLCCVAANNRRCPLREWILPVPMILPGCPLAIGYRSAYSPAPDSGLDRIRPPGVSWNLSHNVSDTVDDRKSASQLNLSLIGRHRSYGVNTSRAISSACSCRQGVRERSGPTLPLPSDRADQVGSFAFADH